MTIQGQSMENERDWDKIKLFTWRKPVDAVRVAAKIDAFIHLKSGAEFFVSHLRRGHIHPLPQEICTMIAKALVDDAVEIDKEEQWCKLWLNTLESKDWSTLMNYVEPEPEIDCVDDEWHRARVATFNRCPSRFRVMAYRSNRWQSSLLYRFFAQSEGSRLRQSNGDFDFTLTSYDRWSTGYGEILGLNCRELLQCSISVTKSLSAQTKAELFEYLAKIDHRGSGDLDIIEQDDVRQCCQSILNDPENHGKCQTEIECQARYPGLATATAIFVGDPEILHRFRCIPSMPNHRTRKLLLKGTLHKEFDDEEEILDRLRELWDIFHPNPIFKRFLGQSWLLDPKAIDEKQVAVFN